MLIRTRLNRRKFLSGLSVGGAALVLPFLQREARAQTAGAAPKRLVVIQTPDGQPGVNWRPTISGTSFTLGPSMQPLNALKSDLVVIEGLNNLAGGGEPHCQAFVQWMTGMAGATDWNANYTASKTLSVDQVVAAESAFVGSTRFKSLQLAADMTGGANEQSHRTMSWGGPNIPLMAEYRPRNNFNRIFDGIAMAAGDAGTTVNPLTANRRSVLDLVIKRDGARLSAKVPAAQRAYFDAHLEAIHQLELKLAAPPSPSPTGPTCVAPNTASYPSDTDSSFTKLPTFMQANFEILRLALACDLTRVATFMSAPSVSMIDHANWASGMTGRDAHHHYSHAEDVVNMRAINTWFAQQIAAFVQSLKNTPDASGQSLLHNTLVLWGTEFGSNGAHSTVNVPFVLFGNAGGSLQTGRALSFMSSPRSTNDLWLSALKLLGIPKATIGDPAKCGGELPGLA